MQLKRNYIGMSDNDNLNEQTRKAMGVAISGTKTSSKGGDEIRATVGSTVTVVDAALFDNAAPSALIEPHYLVSKLGFPEGTDPKALANLLIQLMESPSAEHLRVVGRSSFFFSKFGIEKDGAMSMKVASLTAILVGISQHPAIGEIIHSLQS